MLIFSNKTQNRNHSWLVRLLKINLISSENFCEAVHRIKSAQDVPFVSAQFKLRLYLFLSILAIGKR